MGLCFSKQKYITYSELEETPYDNIMNNNMNNYVIYNEDTNESVYYSSYNYKI